MCLLTLGMMPPTPSDPLLDGIRGLWDSGRFVDVTLCASDGSRHPAHRLVLAAASSYLAALFESRSRSSRSRVAGGDSGGDDDEPYTHTAPNPSADAEITVDVGGEVLGVLLRAIYKGGVGAPFRLRDLDGGPALQELLDGADKLGFLQVRRTCAQQLLLQVSPDVACDIWLSLRAASCHEEAAQVHAYCRHFLHAVVRSDGFARLGEDELVGLLRLADEDDEDEEEGEEANEDEDGGGLLRRHRSTFEGKTTASSSSTTGLTTRTTTRRRREDSESESAALCFMTSEDDVLEAVIAWYRARAEGGVIRASGATGYISGASPPPPPTASSLGHIVDFGNVTTRCMRRHGLLVKGWGSREGSRGEGKDGGDGSGRTGGGYADGNSNDNGNDNGNGDNGGDNSNTSGDSDGGGGGDGSRQGNAMSYWDGRVPRVVREAEEMLQEQLDEAAETWSFSWPLVPLPTQQRSTGSCSRSSCAGSNIDSRIEGQIDDRNHTQTRSRCYFSAQAREVYVGRQGGVDVLGRTSWEVSVLRSEWVRLRSYPWHRSPDRLSRAGNSGGGGGSGRRDGGRDGGRFGDGGGGGRGVLQVAAGRAGEQFDQAMDWVALCREMRVKRSLRERLAMPGLWTFDVR